MIKKPIVVIIILLVFFMTGFGIYVTASPEVVVVNHSNQNIEEVIVKLPSNRIIFGAVAPQTESTIFYSWSQSNGVYEYQISFMNGISQTGECGYVTNHEIGKRLSISVQADLSIQCNESTKL